jgi:hypothetical protein
MLTKEKEKLANKVLLAYTTAVDGSLREWAGKAALHDRMRFPEWSTDYIGSVHAIILTVICRMIEEGFLTLKEDNNG